MRRTLTINKLHFLIFSVCLLVTGMQTVTRAENLLHYYFPPTENLNKTISTGVCIYGGTSAGVVAALELSRLGVDSVIIHPGIRLGGLSAGGLGWTDFGRKDAVQGISREFYQRVGAKYGQSENWAFEPSVALAVFQDMVQEAGVAVYFKAYLDRSPGGIVMSNNRIVRIRTENGLTIQADYFIDATYEGDLMAAAGVTYTTGRESNAAYNETGNGQQVRDKHQFMRDVSPYVVEGDPASGLLPGIETEIPVNGQGDHRIQAYNFRVCMTDVASNRIPFPKPADYDRSWYVLLERYLKAGYGTEFDNFFNKFDRIQGGKTDTNNHGAVSSDFIGQNFDWPEGSYQVREELFQRHITYMQGYWWFVSNDPAVAQIAPTIQTKMKIWGLAGDEFTETNNWPCQLYVREARRMVSDYVITENDFVGRTKAADTVGLASYGMDSHNCFRFVTRSGYVKNDGDVQIGNSAPYRLSYRAIVPRQGECSNLAVPVCVSASHIAYGSVRMEPVFMILAQSSAVAIKQALTTGKADLQTVDYQQLKTTLQQRGQRIYWDLDVEDIEGTIIDSENAAQVNFTGDWTSSSSTPGYAGVNYFHDGNAGKGSKSVTFAFNMDQAGQYDIYVRWTAHDNRASNVPIIINHDGGQAVFSVNQRSNGAKWNLLGRYSFSEGSGSLLISNKNTDGYVIVDAIVVAPVKPEVTSCDDIIAAGLGLAADLTGPNGRPDCYVNLYDLYEMTRQWLVTLTHS